MPKKKLPELNKEKTDEFGCLLHELEFEAGEYRVYPNYHYKKNLQLFQKEVNKDHFWYPPVVTTWKWDPFTNKKKEKVPNSKRPANLHRIIPTHLIERSDGVNLSKDFRENDGAMILRILDVLYETTTQFYDWWWSGRIRLDEKEFDWLGPQDLEQIFKDSFSEWNKWDPPTKQVFLNCCFNFSRSMTYEWDYERFAFLYICVDAIWWVSENQYGVKNMNGKKKGGHADHLNSILHHFQLHQNPAIVQKIVSVRNGLFHQGQWGKKNPMSGRDEDEYRSMRYLHEIVQRCLLRICGIKSSYINSNWEHYTGWKRWN